MNPPPPKPHTNAHTPSTLASDPPQAPRPRPRSRLQAPPRRREDEVMDNPALDPDAHRAALRGLARINRLSHAAPSLWRAIRSIARHHNDATHQPSAHPDPHDPHAPPPLRILDLACGRGDVLIDLARLARRDRVHADLHGRDLSPLALDVAAQAARDARQNIAFNQADALQDPLDPEAPHDAPFDILTCSLFLHHLDPDQVVALLRRMGRAARLGLAVADLERRWLGLALARAAVPFITQSPVVRVDAVRSARAAYTRLELHDLALQAGLEGARIARRWPARMILQWVKP